MSSRPALVHLSPGEGKPAPLGKMGLTFKVGAREGSPWSVAEATLPAGAANPLHAHETAETIFVLAGDFEMVGENGARRAAGPGSATHVPAHAAHGFVNVGPAEGRLLFVMPTSQEAYFEDLSRAIAGAEGDESVAAVRARHRIESLGPIGPAAGRARTSARVDTTDMHAIHAVFRRACADGARHVSRAAERGAALAGLVRDYYTTVLGFLHAHHEAEDAVVWPLLSERCAQHADLVGRMHAQHDAVSAALERAETVLAAWTESPLGPAGAELVAALQALGVELDAHLDEEEAKALPLAAEHLTQQEWSAVPAYAMAHWQSDRRWLILGLAREQMTEAQRAHMLKAMPSPAREAWTTNGERSFAEFARGLRVS